MLFIDTGAFLSRYISKDQYHQITLEKWRQLEQIKQPLCTSNFVLDELLTLLGRRAGYRFAAEKANILYNWERLSILTVEREDELAALSYFKKYADHKISFTDCVSFVQMKKLNIQQVFSYDQHFEFARFELY